VRPDRLPNPVLAAARSQVITGVTWARRPVDAGGNRGANASLGGVVPGRQTTDAENRALPLRFWHGRYPWIWYATAAITTNTDGALLSPASAETPRNVRACGYSGVRGRDGVGVRCAPAACSGRQRLGFGLRNESPDDAATIVDCFHDHEASGALRATASPHWSSLRCRSRWCVTRGRTAALPETNNQLVFCHVVPRWGSVDRLPAARGL
jgi:hypothetical protein